MLDPQAKKTFTGIDGTVGFIMAWDSKNKEAGKGEQEIKKIAEGQRVDFEIRFEKPFEGVASILLLQKSREKVQKSVGGLMGRTSIL